ncbi:MAG: lactonase family protein [Dysgonamonadaceae bacterium]|nr:lactonase family protein [Dysgonamonadaceae bacterium]MDD4729380.1 lactonase family protein [Dysgonamonadaceae bacterium]
MKKFRKIAYLFFITLLLVSCTMKESKKSNDDTLNDSIISMGEMYMLLGTNTSAEGSKGIYVYKIDTDTGESEKVSMVDVANPSYLVISPNEKFVYSVGIDDKNGYAHSFSFDKESGNLTLLNSQLTVGRGPTYITLNAKGNNVITANYSGGSISQFNVNSDGTLSPLSNLFQFEGKGTHPKRQLQPHLHSVRYSPDGSFLFAADLGTDKVYRYKTVQSVFEGQPALLENDTTVFMTPEGTGPRHFDFHPNGLYFYLLGELSGEVIVYDYNMGDLQQKQIILADSVRAGGSADIHVSPNGRFLYASNRLQEDGIAVFAIDPQDGTLTKIGYQLTGKHPRNFAITPSGKFLLVASRDDNVIQVFAIDKKTGMLQDTKQDIFIDKPVCIKFTRLN